MKESNEYLLPEFGAPHVFLLGAGASRAACSGGDKHGAKLPLMNDLIDTLGLRDLLVRHGLGQFQGDFELLYSKVFHNAELQDLVIEVERRVFDYFSSLELPDDPTLYDHIVLSLRPKDVIATFNWDPLLWQSLCRNAARFGPDLIPRALFLHGNVALGYCNKHVPGSVGWKGNRCDSCGSPLRQSRLLYPVAEKCYSGDPSIERSWQEMERALKKAYMFTIFGYRSPSTDAEAVNLMKAAWGNADSRELEQIEIIDIRASSEDGCEALEKSWSPFICREHYGIGTSFYESYAAQHPRRSCEDFFSASMNNRPQVEAPIPDDSSWKSLEARIDPLLAQEREFRRKNR